MFNNVKLRNTESTNEWNNWIEDAIAKRYLRFYEYKYFSNVQIIGSGGFGMVYRANWKDYEHYFVLKSFFNLNDVTVKEIVNEVISENFHF